MQYILDTVTRCLVGAPPSLDPYRSLTSPPLDNPERRFTYVEIAYFWRWWNEQTEEMKATFTELVQSGRLEFVSAGPLYPPTCRLTLVVRLVHERRG